MSIIRMSEMTGELNKKGFLTKTLIPFAGFIATFGTCYYILWFKLQRDSLRKCL